MSLVVSILCPSGHTVTVRVGPNEPVDKIVKEACAKRKLSPGEYFLKHGREKLDSALSVRLAGLANRAKLELLEKSEEEKAAIQTNGHLVVALQTEDGKRSMAEFSLATSLADVVHKLGQSKGGGEGCIPTVIGPTNMEVRGMDDLRRTTLAGMGFSAGKRELLRLKYVDSEKEKQVAEENAHTAASRTTHQTDGHQQRQSSPPRRAMRVDDGQSMLRKLIERDQPVDLHREGKSEAGSEQSSESWVQETLDLTSMESRSKDGDEPMPDDGDDEGDAVEITVESDNTPAVLQYVGERHAVVYHADDMIGKQTTSIEDSFFEITLDDVKQRQRELKAESKRLEEGGELSTRAFKEAQREASKMKTLQVYHKTVLRVQFSDRHILQAAFLCGESVKDVLAFVKTFLMDDSLPLELFVTPPKRTLKPSATLLDEELVPMTMVFVTSSGTQPKLKPEFLDKKSNAKGVVQAALAVGVRRNAAN